jgi:hypothetical protein
MALQAPPPSKRRPVRAPTQKSIQDLAALESDIAAQAPPPPRDVSALPPCRCRTAAAPRLAPRSLLTPRTGRPRWPGLSRL